MSIFPYIGALAKRLRYNVIDPTRDWIAMLTFAGIALAGILAWHLWVFQTVIEGGDLSSMGTSTPSLLDPAELKTIRALFEKRAAEERKYEIGIYTFLDPSQ